AAVPDRARDVRPGRGRALLALVVEGAAGQRGMQRVHVGRRVGDDEVLAAGLADEPRVRLVVSDVRADRLPQVLEDAGRAGEVERGDRVDEALQRAVVEAVPHAG